jgi:hypothetical protein
MKLHRLDVVSLIFGLAFTALGIFFAVATDPWQLFSSGIGLRWMGPALLIVIGAAIVAPLFRRRGDTVAHPGEAPVEPEIAGADTDLDETLTAARAELPPEPGL